MCSFLLDFSPVPSTRWRIKLLLKNSSATSTVLMSVTSRYISLAECISPDDDLTIILEYEPTRF